MLWGILGSLLTSIGDVFWKQAIYFNLYGKVEMAFFGPLPIALLGGLALSFGILPSPFLTIEPSIVGLFLGIWVCTFSADTICQYCYPTF